MSRTRLLLAASLVGLVAAGGWLRLDARLREGPDLKPRPDALEYGLTADRLARGGDYTLSIDGVVYPPRYPPGFPLLAAPILRVTGGDLFDTWKASFFYALLAIGLTALVAHLLAGPIAALGAGALMACSPAHVLTSGLAMSETAVTALIAAAMLLSASAIRGRPDRPRLLPLALAGLAVGGAFSIRYTGLAFLLPIFLLLATRHRLAPERKLLPTATFLLPTITLVAAVLAYNARTFGQMLRDGYHFWVPALYGTPLCFNPAYLFKPGPAAPWPEGNLRVYSETLLGLRGDLITLPLAALALIGAIWTARKARDCAIARLIALTAWVALPAILAFHLVYYWQDPRFLMPFLPVIAVLAGAGARGIFDLLARTRRSRAAALVASGVALSLAVHLGWPVLTAATITTPPLVDALQTLDDDLERDAMVIVNFPLSIAAATIGRDRTLLVDDQATSDPHLAAIAAYALPGLEARRPNAAYLAAGGHPIQQRIQEVKDRVAAERPVYVIVAAFEAPEGPGILGLRAQFTLDEIFFRKPITVYQLRPR